MNNLKKFDQFVNEEWDPFGTKRRRKEEVQRNRVYNDFEKEKYTKHNEVKLKILQDNDAYLKSLIDELNTGNFNKTKIDEEFYRILMNDGTKIKLWVGYTWDQSNDYTYILRITKTDGEEIESRYSEDKLNDFIYFTEVSKELTFLVKDVVIESDTW